MYSERLYWHGNSAKCKIIDAILRQVEAGRETLVFDYGCGACKDWPLVLSDYPSVRLIGFDPSAERIRTARARLKGHGAELLTGDELSDLHFKADFIVSLSVLEHVRDRRAYLRTAKKHLADHGVLYLNYDDGHFRNYADLSSPRLWPETLKAWLLHALPSMGRRSSYLRRVRRAAVDRLVDETGFRVEGVFYSNLAALKELCKTLPDEKREPFTRLWVGFEDELNSRFLVEEGEETMGDIANLWRFMGTRTLVLRHK
jgi:SAM-dependent methyltransferase